MSTAQVYVTASLLISVFGSIWRSARDPDWAKSPAVCFISLAIQLGIYAGVAWLMFKEGFWAGIAG